MASGALPPPDPRDEDAIAHLSYTSGTTGRPKGACLAHEPTVRAARCIGERLRVRPDDVSFGPTALSSSYQLVANLLPPLAAGATINVMGKWTEVTGFDAIEATGATMFIGNPTVLGEILQQSRVRGVKPSRLRFGLSGGGPTPAALKKAWRDELGLPLVESYGQSELGGFVGLGYPELVPDARLLAVGPPLPDKEVRILDAAGNILPVGEIGEICLRGGFMRGYFGRPEATAKALANGWLHTGDAGLIGADGAVTMRGRFSELITVAGRTWYPRDVEDALADQPGILQAALVAVPDAKLGSRPVACVTVAGGAIDPAALKSAIAGRLPYDLAPLDIRTIDAFPMTPTGKIAKADLRASLSAAA
jgi:acyl-CoA synthetase (AMP-forming)/AMP-acid ligase II